MKRAMSKCCAGARRASFDFPVKDHVELGEQLGGLDFETAVKIAGSRFSLMKGGVAGCTARWRSSCSTPIPPSMATPKSTCPIWSMPDSMFGTGQLPKFEEDLFRVPRSDGSRLYLIPTAEVPVTNMVRDEIVAAEALPLKFVCHTPCFRSEAGS